MREEETRDNEEERGMEDDQMRENVETEEVAMESGDVDDVNSEGIEVPRNCRIQIDDQDTQLISVMVVIQRRKASLYIAPDGSSAQWLCHRAKCGWHGVQRAEASSKTGNLTKAKTKREIKEQSLELEPLRDQILGWFKARMISTETLRRTRVMQKKCANEASRIILAIDGDPPGRALAEELARRLGKDRFVLTVMGPNALREVIDTAELYPIRGLFNFEDFFEEIDAYYHRALGYESGMSTGWKVLNDLYNGMCTLSLSASLPAFKEVANWATPMN